MESLAPLSQWYLWNEHGTTQDEWLDEWLDEVGSCSNELVELDIIENLWWGEQTIIGSWGNTGVKKATWLSPSTKTPLHPQIETKSLQAKWCVQRGWCNSWPCLLSFKNPIQKTCLGMWVYLHPRWKNTVDSEHIIVNLVLRRTWVTRCGTRSYE